MKFQTENSQRETFKKVSREQNEQSQQDDNSSQCTIYYIGAMVLFLLFIFWLQLKVEIQDQNLFSKQITSLNNKQNSQSKVNIEISSLKQNQSVVNIYDVAEIQKMLNGTYNIHENFDFLFSSMENWDKKNYSQNMPNQAKQNIQQTRYIPFKSKPFNFYNIKPSPPKISSPNNPNKQQLPLYPASAGLRAGLKAQQIDLAKRLVNVKNVSMSSDLAQEQKKYYEDKYSITKFKELPFCIVIPSYNNTQSQRYINNMNSILQQDYSNYHIVFIDDASQDGTGNLMRQYAKNHRVSQKKLQIIINPNRTMAMPNIYRAAKQFCKPYQIFIIVDGDDQLLGRQVLKLFNSIYQTQQKWVVYTNFLSIRGSIGYSRPYSQTVIQMNSFRKAGFVISHLRSFYTKLLTLVKEEDFHDEQGNWFRAANDVAMYIPILQMTHRRVAYIPEITYLYNSNTGLNNHRVKLKQQKGNQKKVKARTPYQQLPELFTEEQRQALKNSMDNKIQIRDLTLPEPQNKQKIKVFGWELE